jgi:hypothetical protein
MQKINIKSVKDGMVLAEPLKSAHGVLILDRGVTLTESFAGRLARMGVFTVCVEGEQVEKESVLEAQVSEIQKIPLEKLFEGKIENDFMQEIYSALLRYRESGGE